ncbi:MULTISPECIES: PEP/pyruvate-binding domain-containing protein [unclassified Rhodococcus (in: high G+C Gram-positive bacteria)]|uniref:PEP/pyruvate-binding domain-containing protein n=1 Tax=unclassified Rhodococcus (in: high G+C Gram-positive bacteria) TaxID=192944 RepID=UPI0024B71C19|nr:MULTISPECIES: PEP/pyruvate-binding domain-containing protein [unclassified Rhodococcus (in: high G+C Gram-positive bacteria)]MDI9949934.1 PEP/pyruvate-binding domain-containing protein [Rhodococcus sp. IEGM 1305]MDI9973318.1 PEP/pyruvate-binding domain-containing protein [Rhodococcus sp. IEGM 1307]
MPIVPLPDASERCGAKARNLGLLLRAGFRVPAGFVIPDPLGDPGWERAIEAGLHRLGPGPFAVRSSALAEDGAESSFAGQLATTLGVTTTAEVIEAVHRSAASCSSPEAVAYAARTDREAPASAGVIVQVMVQPATAGVMFTRHPVTGAEQVVIEAARGLGEAVVAGTVTPEAYLVDGVHVQVARHRGGQLLTTAQALALAALGRDVESLFGCPQDIEWAIAGDDIWVLQARPITTASSAALPVRAMPGEMLLTGVAASPGTAAGPARIIGSLDDFARFRSGDVLVCRTTSPAWTPLLARACAVVTETGGMLAHAAIVAREFGIPAVLAAAGAMTTLTEGRRVRVDGTHGHVGAAGRM